MNKISNALDNAKLIVFESSPLVDPKEQPIHYNTNQALLEVIDSAQLILKENQQLSDRVSHLEHLVEEMKQHSSQ